MNIKPFLPAALIIPIVGLAVSVNNKESDESKLAKKIESIPDSLFQDVKKEHLINDEVYIKLAQDGWSSEEIRTIMSDFLKDNKKKLKRTYEYTKYAKQWLPTYGNTAGADTIYQFTDTAYSEKMVRAVRRASAAQGDNSFDNYYNPEEYSPEPRMRGDEPQPGIFRPLKPKPSSGRILWIQPHPTDPDKIMVIPDGCGIARTDDNGKHWDMITERIPKREHRNYATHSAIPVDPDDWNHVFAFMANGNPVYETTDGGQTWTQVEGATHKGFKRGYAFRDSKKTLKFIGATRNDYYWNSTLWVSDDKGVTWDAIAIPDDLKDTNPAKESVKGAWFQEVAFHPTNRDTIYIPTSRSIFYFDDGARYTVENGTRKYNLKKMQFTVWNTDSTTVRCTGYNFPFLANTQAFLNINPNNPLEMWFSSASRNNAAVNGSYSAIYRTRDGGKNWITLNEPANGFGSGLIYGNETPWGWLGGFGVNYLNQDKVYGCTMSSGYSNDGGINCSNYAWSARLTSLQEDGKYYSVSNSRHNADNHCIASHKDGRVYRGSDGGMLMIDPNINNGNWTNIGGDMGQMLFYCIKTNEFGDQVLLGNTQDIDVQTYRDGRWGAWRGYEGSMAMINPYSNMCYYSGGGGGLTNLSFSSWAPCTTLADVCTGYWYVQQNNRLYVVKDVGRTAVELPIVNASGVAENVQEYGISRNGEKDGQSTLWVKTNGVDMRYTHDDFATAATTMKIPSQKTVRTFATDPDNWQQLYIVTYENNQAQIQLINMITQKVVEDLTHDIPSNLACSKIYLHEGSGDLYFYNSSMGIYVLPKGEKSWKFWTKGYNCAKSGSILINYATQEMVLCDYGRGIFCADLENPADRYFSNGFALKELSNVDGQRTIGIDTQWTIPLYHNYKWTVNGNDVNNPYQYLTKSLNVGDKVQLELSLRENPRVKTLSKEYVVTATTATTSEHKSGNALYSNGNGRVDLGNVDLFLNDFTIELWVKPESNTGVILANGQRTQTRDGRGWWLGLDGGTLKFNYAPANRFSIPTYETSYTQEETLSAGALATGQWSHVAVSQQRNGSIAIYVNGVKTAETTRILQDYPLNNSVNLSLFADGYEESTLAATVDELKIWNYAMQQSDIRRVMMSHKAETAGLVYYNNFNGSTLAEDVEQFSQQAPISRIMAETKAVDAVVPVYADYVANADLSGSTNFTDEGKQLINITPKTESQAVTNLSVFGFTENMLTATTANLATDRYTLEGLSYTVVAFGDYDSEQSVSITFPVDNQDSKKRYQVYSAPYTSTLKYWEKLGATTTTADGQQLSDIALGDIVGKRLILVSLSEGIELSPDAASVGNDGYVGLYDTYTYLPFEASLYGDKTVSNKGYKVVASDPDNVTVENELYFVNGTATGQVRINSEIAPKYGETIEITLQGEDDLMIPYVLRVKNKQLPTEIGDGLAITNGGFYVGDVEQFSSLTNSNNMTFMTWVRFDNDSFLSGAKGVMIFRNATNRQATGLHIQAGNVRCHWNEENWSWNTATDLNITAEDIGRWVHIAMVVRPTGIDFYLNGKKSTLTRTINKTGLAARMMLGQTDFDQTWFSGAFDQTMVWNRSLSQEEVLEYMQNGPKLSDESLIAYLNMDYFDEDDRPLELVKDAIVTKSGGTVEAHRHTDIPYAPAYTADYSADNMPDDATWRISVNDATPTYRIASFKGYSNNFADSDATSLYHPIEKECFTLVWPEQIASVDSTTTVVFTYSNQSITSGSQLELGIRKLGTSAPYANRISATAEADGKVSFTVPADSIASALEMMVFTTAASSPIKASLSLATSETRDIQSFVLKENESEIPVKLNLISGTNDSPIEIYIAESEYASASKQTIVPTDDNASFTIKINRDKLAKKDWNKITAKLLGVECNTLELRVALEPKVRIYTDNSDDKFTATSTVATIPVKIELLQGILDEDVKLETLADVPGVINGATGALLTNATTSMPTLNYYNVDNKFSNGWNLVANPYLASINLSKRQNYTSENTSRFIYSFDRARRNFIVSDVDTYEEDKLIDPFSAFFVQAQDKSATFAVTAEAKELSLNRHTYDHDTADQLNSLTVQLYADNNVADETKVIWAKDASEDVVLDEDATKMFSIDESVEHIYTTANGESLAINTLPLKTISTPLALTITTPGAKTLKVKSLYHVQDSCKVALYDKVTDTETALEAGTTYNFNATAAGTLADRFTIVMTDYTTLLGTSSIINSGYLVTTDKRRCDVSGLKGDAVIRIYDISGRTIVNDHASSATYSTVLSAGYYVVEINENAQTYTAKIVIR